MSESCDDIRSDITDALKGLCSEAVELYLGRSVPALTRPPDPLTFHRDFVSHNRFG